MARRRAQHRDTARHKQVWKPKAMLLRFLCRVPDDPALRYQRLFEEYIVVDDTVTRRLEEALQRLARTQRDNAKRLKYDTCIHAHKRASILKRRHTCKHGTSRFCMAWLCMCGRHKMQTRVHARMHAHMHARHGKQSRRHVHHSTQTAVGIGAGTSFAPRLVASYSPSRN